MLQCQIRGIESTRRDALALCIRFASYRIAEKHGILAPIYPTSPTSVGEDSFFDGASRMAISLGDGDKGYADISLRQPPDVINAIESQVLCGVAIIRKIGCDLLAPSTCDVAYHETRSDDGDHEFRRRPVIDPTSVATKASRAPISPIIPEETWECFVQSLPHFGGDASQARRATKAQMTVSLSWAPVSRL
ncbi:hypothetical protein BXZ70DRAFT_1010644 [Cristinia sonorae]|uniref:Uncharacterized protein n=1 Tax=Cristinia sonorae TaxID=1940300 RepID=A0A8K0UKE9_9AGAR|nr:hypothetical protein BXZ70DRAFT_1010644 [Cristinia sonorae]